MRSPCTTGSPQTLCSTRLTCRVCSRLVSRCFSQTQMAQSCRLPFNDRLGQIPGWPWDWLKSGPGTRSNHWMHFDMRRLFLPSDMVYNFIGRGYLYLADRDIVPADARLPFEQAAREALSRLWS